MRRRWHSPQIRTGYAVPNPSPAKPFSRSRLSRPQTEISRLPLRFQFSFGPQTADDLVEIGFRERTSRTQQNAGARFFDGELRARAPRPGSAYRLGQDDLALGGEPGGFHR